MDALWPWLAAAGLGALHGANPAAGWMFVAASASGANEHGAVRRALLSIGVGHVASIAIVAAAALAGWTRGRDLVPIVAVGLIVVAASMACGSGRPRRVGPFAGRAALTLWSFAISSAHGSGLMLVPALLPLCTAGSRPGATMTGSLLLAIAAVGVHTAAMLATTGALAAGVRSGIVRHRSWTDRAGGRGA